MSRIGLPLATRASTVLWCPWRDGSLSDLSASALVPALAGTGLAPERGAGLLGDGLLFTSGTVTGITSGALAGRYISVPNSSPLNISPNLTIEFQARTDEASTAVPIVECAGWGVSFSYQAISFGVVASGGGFDTLVYTAPFSWLGRHVDVRAVAKLESGVIVLYIFADGCLVARKVTALVDLKVSGLGALKICEPEVIDADTTTQFKGILGPVRINAASDIDPATCSPNLGPVRIGRRQLRRVEADLAESPDSSVWAADGGGGFVASLDDLTLGETVVDRLDVVGISAKVSGVRVDLAEVGNLTDLHAAIVPSWFLDATDLYLDGLDPTDAATVKQLKVVVRQRWADSGIVSCGRYYAPVLTSPPGAGSRAAAWWNQALQLGEGGTLTLATQSLPADIADLITGRVSWTNAPVSIYCGADGMPACEWTAEFWGLVDKQPDATTDVLAVTIYNELGRLYRVPAEQERADVATYPHMDPAHDGYQFPTPIGAGLQSVPFVCIDTVGRLMTTLDANGNTATFRVYLYKWANLPNAKLYGWGPPALDGTASMFNIDLDACTFETTWQPGGTVNAWRSSLKIDGFGAPSDPTSPVDASLYSGGRYQPWGDTADCYTLPGPLLSNLLALRLGWVAGESFADTGSRVHRNVRGFDWSNLAAIVFGVSRTTFTQVWTKPATKTVEWSDVNKARPVTRIIRAEDVISRRKMSRQDDLARKAVASALAYPVTPPGFAGAEPSTTTTLELDTDELLDAKAVTDLGQTGCYNLGTVTEVLETARSLGLEAPIEMEEILVSQAHADAEQFDVADLRYPPFDPDVENRYIVLSVHPQADGVKLLCGPEAPWAEDGTSTSASRTPRRPQIHARYASDLAAGTPISTTGSWQFLGDGLTLYQGAYTTFGAGIAHRLIAYASRTGGVAGDMQLRLVQVDPDDMTTVLATLATISSVSPTSLGFTTPVTSFADIPTADSILRWQYNLAVGVAGHVAGIEWLSEETGSIDVLSLPPASLLHADGYAPGAAVDIAAQIGPGYFQNVPSLRLGLVNFVNSWPIGATMRILLYADPDTAVDLVVFIAWASYVSADVPPQLRLSTFPAWRGSVSIPSRGFYALEDIPPASIPLAAFRVCASVTSGVGKIYGVSVVIQNHPGAA